MKNEIVELMEILEMRVHIVTLRVPYKDLVEDIISQLKTKSVDDELEYNALIELYKYTKFGDTVTSIDPRGDNVSKFGALNSIKEAVESGLLTQEIIDNLRIVNESCLSYILDPLKLSKDYAEFYKKYPNARF